MRRDDFQFDNGAVLILSGGMDSATLLYQLVDAGTSVKALTFDYGQRHAVEIEAASELASKTRVEWELVDLSGVGRLIARGSQTGNDPVPEGHYAEESMKTTVVPNRNMLMLAVAAGHAITRQADVVAYAAHGGDHAIYPDCRKGFVEKLGAAIEIADWHSVKLFAPYLDLTKADIAREGALLGVPFGATWSCYKGGTKHCGKCGTCVERIEAFSIAGLVDPTSYLDR